MTDNTSTLTTSAGNTGKISIIMAVFNCADTLPAAIDSILDQSYTNWEFVICDDCSTDNTYEVLKDYKEAYPDRFVIIQNGENKRLAFSLNRCLEYASGEYIARMDGDDISVPERLEKQIIFLKENSEIQLVGTAMHWFNENGKANIIYKPDRPDRFCLRSKMPFHHATIMTYKYVFNTLCGYTVSKRTYRAQDYDLWFRFFQQGFRGANIYEALYLVREDEKAVERRKPSVYWNAYKTTLIGFRLLEYPVHWYIKPTLVMLVKVIMPLKLRSYIRLKQMKFSD